MNGKLAKKLRRIARGLELDTATKYVPSKPVNPGYFSAPNGRRCEQLGSLPPFVMVKCERRAYKEAKKVYLGKPLTMLEPKDG
jgi:hypothetical protein